MAWWNFLTSSEKVVDTAADLVKDAASGIDMLFFTDEEKSQASAKVMESVIRMNEATKDENSVRSQTRRFLAKVIIWNYVILVDVAAAFYVASYMSDTPGERAAREVTADAIFTLANEALGAHVLAVVIFYFGYYGIKQVFKKKD